MTSPLRYSPNKVTPSLPALHAALKELAESALRNYRIIEIHVASAETFLKFMKYASKSRQNALQSIFFENFLALAQMAGLSQ